MTFADWLTESKRRFREQSSARAARESVGALRRGVQRRLAAQLGQTIWERGDWDVLVVLDACRADLWQEVVAHSTHDLPPVGSVWSNAACSIDWIQRNLAAHPDKIADTAYVTANPFTNHDGDARSAELTARDFAYLDRAYETAWGPIDGTAVETVPPAAMTERAIDVWRRRDELGAERLIVHYMQPHQPFRSRPDWEDIGKNLKNLVADDGIAGACAWQRCRHGMIDEEALWAAYRDNLRWVLDDVAERLLKNLDAEDVIITADHGNAMGEFGEWAHPPGALSPAVRRVPWVRVAATDKETVTPDTSPTAGGEDVEAQLEALGYV